MNQIVFATNNPNKLKEIRQKIGDQFEVLGLKDIDCTEELPETHETLLENAIEKAEYVAKNYKVDCFADDSGLMIDALNGEPGVYSAMYSGTRDTQDNMDKVLSNLEDKSERSASFTTIIALVKSGETITFEGKVEGAITLTKSGADGFGYDPIFKPTGFDITFAEMTASEKNAISHRGKAVEQLVDYLK